MKGSAWLTLKTYCHYSQTSLHFVDKDDHQSDPLNQWSQIFLAVDPKNGAVSACDSLSLVEYVIITVSLLHLKSCQRLLRQNYSKKNRKDQRKESEFE